MIWNGVAPRLSVVATILFVLAPPVSARIEKVENVNGVSGKTIAAPPGVADGAIADNDHMLGFDERQNVVLDRDLAVDDGIIPTGTMISSHMILLNVPDDGWSASGVNDWTFSERIIGVMSDIDGELEAESTPFLGASGTRYPTPFGLRGLENWDGYEGVGTRTLRVTLSVSQPGDWIRVKGLSLWLR